MTTGFLVVDKPAGITSHDVVSVLRGLLRIKKIGHTGTLDPFATGVLPMAIGPSTRLIQFLDESVKVYEGTIALGRATDTGDPMGETVREAPVPMLEDGAVQKVLSRFVGEQMQTPPAYSAVKVRGKALYRYARAGESVEVAPRKIRIDCIDLLARDERTLDVRVTCGRGTYVRVLAEDIGEALGTCGHLASLRRTASGPFAIEAAIDFEQLSMLAAQRTDWPAVLRPARGAERVKWAAPDVIRTGIMPFMRGPKDVLGHMPMVELNAGDLVSLRKRGHVFAVPESMPEGAHWVATSNHVPIAVLRRDGRVGRVARMMPSS